MKKLNIFVYSHYLVKKLGVSYSTVNRWEKDKTKPNYLALKSIDNFCKIHKISFDISEYALEVHIL